MLGLLILVFLTEGPRRLLTQVAYIHTQRWEGHRTRQAAIAHPGKWGSQLGVGSLKLGRTIVRTAIRSTGWLLGR
jgi:hypothetical protein